MEKNVEIFTGRRFKRREAAWKVFQSAALGFRFKAS
jgi:hypothetical protein